MSTLSGEAQVSDQGSPIGVLSQLVLLMRLINHRACFAVGFSSMHSAKAKAMM